MWVSPRANASKSHICKMWHISPKRGSRVSFVCIIMTVCKYISFIWSAFGVHWPCQCSSITDTALHIRILHSIHLAMVVKLINFSSSQLIVGFRCVCPVIGWEWHWHLMGSISMLRSSKGMKTGVSTPVNWHTPVFSPWRGEVRGNHSQCTYKSCLP